MGWLRPHSLDDMVARGQNRIASQNPQLGVMLRLKHRLIFAADVSREVFPFCKALLLAVMSYICTMITAGLSCAFSLVAYYQFISESEAFKA